MLRKGQLKEAVRLYNKAAVWAPYKAWDSPELAAACACRGAASYQMGNHLVALEDVYYAMQTISFNGGIRFKTDCRLKAAHRGEGARQSLLAIKDFLAGLEASGFEEEQKEEVRLIIERVLEKVEKEGREGKNAIQDPGMKKELTTPHRHLPSLSSALRVAHRPKAGRHLVATRDIEEGEVVAIEAAAASRLLPLPCLSSSRCCHCLADAHIAFPCLTCTAVVFCSRDCRAAAAAPSLSGKGKRGAHHQWECQWALADLALGVGVFNICQILLVKYSININICPNKFIDIGVDIFKNGPIYINIFNKCHLNDNQYGLSIYRTPLFGRH